MPLVVKIRAALGPRVGSAGTVHVERPGGAVRDRLNALTRKTHAFAKWDASLRCTRWFADLRSPFSSGTSRLALTAWGRGASLSPSVSSDGSGID